eukprot:TRINITY_DN1166_c0_g1_i1.p1 TRINITY_DN1166_c0_g1~~TRINITY_DN1166_c0_g1_i1.p1  ORF type:complete len:140 (-),score=55.57 TRINITY_DN1166_c0_g1_i1:71-490(-)
MCIRDSINAEYGGLFRHTLHGAKLMEPPTSRVCLVCQRQYSKYTCPRCNAPYCSVQCYKGHSERCTECFYQESACEELKGMHSSSEQRNDMMQALQRQQDQQAEVLEQLHQGLEELDFCLLYTSPSPRDRTRSRMPSSA